MEDCSDIYMIGEDYIHIYYIDDDDQSDLCEIEEEDSDITLNRGRS